MALGMLARKKGMTTLLDEKGFPIPVTVLVAGPCVVVNCRTVKDNGYEAIQLGFEEDARKHGTTRAVAGHFAKSKVKVHRVLQEFRCDDASKFRVGQSLTVEAFAKGDVLEIRGKTKGRGFQGVIKRHGKHGGPATHGSHFHRSTGSIGQRTWPGKVFKSMRMPGHMGNVFRTIRGLEVVDVDTALNLLFVRGGIPGAKNGLVRITNCADDFESRFAAKDGQSHKGSKDKSGDQPQEQAKEEKSEAKDE